MRASSFLLLSLCAPLAFAQTPNLNGFWNAQPVPSPEGKVLLDKLPADASVEQRYAAARAVANELVVVADQLQVLALRVMHAELAELPE